MMHVIPRRLFFLVLLGYLLSHPDHICRFGVYPSCYNELQISENFVDVTNFEISFQIAYALLYT